VVHRAACPTWLRTACGNRGMSGAAASIAGTATQCIEVCGGVVCWGRRAVVSCDQVKLAVCVVLEGVDLVSRFGFRVQG
jgi:hypothetical protein